MAEAKDYIWLCPFIGAILTGISIYTPAAYKSTGDGLVFLWMYGFALLTGGEGPEPDYVFTHTTPGYYIPGIVATVFLTICVIILFVSSLTHRKKETPGSWIALGILLILGVIYFIVGVEIGVATYWHNQDPPAPYRISFWGEGYNYNPGFAVIAPFIGGGITLLGAVLGKTIGRQEGIVKPAAIPQVEVEEKVLPPKVAPEPIPPVEVEEKVLPPKVAPEPIPPKVVKKVVPKVTPVVIKGKVDRIEETFNPVQIFEGHGKGISSVVFSPDGKYVVSASNDKTIKIWEISSGKLIRTL